MRQNFAKDDMLLLLEFQSGSKNSQNPQAVLFERQKNYQNIAFKFNSVNKKFLAGLVRYGLKPEHGEPRLSFLWVPRLKHIPLDQFTSSVNLEKLIRFDRNEIEKTREILNTNLELFESRQLSHDIESFGSLGRHILGTQITSSVPMERELISGSDDDILTQHSLNLLLKPHSSPVGLWFHIEETPMPLNMAEKLKYESQSALKREKWSKDRHASIGNYDTVIFFVERRFKHTRDQLEDREDMRDFWHYEIFLRKANLNHLLQDRALYPIPYFKLSQASISNPPKSKGATKKNELSVLLNHLTSSPFNLVQNSQELDAILNGMFAATPKIPRVFPINKQLTSAQYTLQVQNVNNVDSNDPYYQRMNPFATVNIALADKKMIKTADNRLSSPAVVALKKLREELRAYEVNLLVVAIEENSREVRRHKFISHSVVCSNEWGS